MTDLLASALTPEQRSALDTLSAETTTYWNRPDSKDQIITRMARDTAFRERYFLRYLTRDHFDLVKCKKRLIATFEWRVSFGLDNGPIDRTDLLQDETTCPVYNLPPFKSKTGDCLFFCWVAIMNPSIIDADKHCKFIVSIMDEAMLRMGDGERFIAIMNCSNVSWAASSSTQAWSPVLNIMRQHFPEIIRSLIMVNTATFFRVGFTMIRPFIGQRTADRFMPLGTDWHDKVAHLIDADQIPAHWGEGGSYLTDWGPYGRKQAPHLTEAVEEAMKKLRLKADGSSSSLARTLTTDSASTFSEYRESKSTESGDENDEDVFEDADQ